MTADQNLDRAATRRDLRRSQLDEAAAQITAWEQAMTRSHGDDDYSVLAPHSPTRLRGSAVRALLAEREALLEELLRLRVQQAVTASNTTLEEIAGDLPEASKLLAAVKGDRRFSTLDIALISDATGTPVSDLLRGAEPAPESPRIIACTSVRDQASP